HRRRRHAHEPVPEESPQAPQRRQDAVQVPRVRQLPRRLAPAPGDQDVERLADLSDGVREGTADWRGERAGEMAGEWDFLNWGRTLFFSFDRDSLRSADGSPRALLQDRP